MQGDRDNGQLSRWPAYQAEAVSFDDRIFLKSLKLLAVEVDRVDGLFPKFLGKFVTDVSVVTLVTDVSGGVPRYRFQASSKSVLKYPLSVLSLSNLIV